MNADTRTIAELAPALQDRTVTSTSITERCLARIGERNPSLNAFITVLADEALEQARAADREIAAGRHRGPLHGVPISLKDLIDLRGTATTAASRVRQSHLAGADAPIVARLRDAGAIFIGKTNLHEFAFGTTNEDSAYGPARHPLDESRSPGGSSGGSAASVLDGMAYASIGTDTGGSIRIPSAACGLVGLKATAGEIPTWGVVPLSTTMDHVGPICRSVADARIVYDVLRAAPAPVPGRQERIGPDTDGGGARRLRFGIPREYFLAALDTEVATAFDSACERLRGAGVELDEVTIPHAGDIAPIYLHIVLSEAAAYHAHTLDSRPEDYTPNVRLRLETGRYLLAEDYVRALQGRDILRREVDEALQAREARGDRQHGGRRDGLLLPSLAVPAPRLGAETVRVGATDEPVRGIMLRLTQLFNLTGHPAITLPCGATREGLPIGAQLVGHGGHTPKLLDDAAAVERYLGPGMSR